jgi:hypothetical protein
LPFFSGFKRIVLQSFLIVAQVKAHCKQKDCKKMFFVNSVLDLLDLLLGFFGSQERIKY